MGFSSLGAHAAKGPISNLTCGSMASKEKAFGYSEDKKEGVLGAAEVLEEVREFRLLMTTAVGQVLKNGLKLLGIEAPERM